MISIKRTFSDKYIDRGEFVEIVEKIIAQDYSALFYNLSKNISNTLEVKFDNRNYSDIFFNHDEYPYKSKIEIEIFTKNQVIFYVLKGQPEYKSIFVDKDEIENAFLEFGAIGDKTNLVDKFDKFLNLFKKIRLNFERERYSESNPEFNIFTLRQDTALENQLLDFDGLKTKLKFTKPGFSKDELKASLVLSESEFRKTLILINSGGKVLEENLLKKAVNKKRSLQILNKLLEAKMISKINIVKCRKTSKLLSEFNEESLPDKESLKTVNCFECGRSYDDELQLIGYKSTELGRRLILSSHWMTILVSDELNRQGISDKSILWNIELTGDEIDLMLGLNNQLFVIELKDKVFGSGNAHALNYRRTKFKANKAIIITTEKIAKDAKIVFEDIKKDYKGENPDKIIPIYIEGLENIGLLVSSIMEDLDRYEIFYKMKHIQTMTGFNFIELIDKKFNTSLMLLDLMNDEY